MTLIDSPEMREAGIESAPQDYPALGEMPDRPARRLLAGRELVTRSLSHDSAEFLRQVRLGGE